LRLCAGIFSFKSQDWFRFDGRQPKNVDLTASTGTVEKIDMIVMSDPDDTVAKGFSNQYDRNRVQESPLASNSIKNQQVTAWHRFCINHLRPAMNTGD
jgi:hypothetical protein